MTNNQTQCSQCKSYKTKDRRKAAFWGGLGIIAYGIPLMSLFLAFTFIGIVAIPAVAVVFSALGITIMVRSRKLTGYTCHNCGYVTPEPHIQIGGKGPGIPA